MANDPNGKLNVPRDAGYWLRDDTGKVLKSSNTSAGTAACSRMNVMMRQQTWNDILAAMLQVRENHGWKG